MATSAGKGPDSRGRAHPLSMEAVLELLDGTGVLLGADGNLCREGTRLKRKSSSSKRGGGAGATGGSGVLLGAAVHLRWLLPTP